MSVGGNGSYFPPNSTNPVPQLTEFGVWRYTVAYSGDDRNEPAATSCGANNVTVVVRTPFFSLCCQSSVPVGGSTTVFGSTFVYQPTQAVTLRVYDPSDTTCSRAPTMSRQVSPQFFQEIIGPFEVVGTWRFVMSYPGDANNHPATSACGAFPFEVTKASAVSTPLVSPQAVEVGKAAQGARTSGYRPTGSLAVRVFAPGDTSCSSAVFCRRCSRFPEPDRTRSRSPRRRSARGRSRRPTQVTNNNAGALPCGSHPIEVGKAVPTLALEATPATARPNSTLDARVTLDGGFNPTGSVEFRLFDPQDTACTTPTHVETGALSSGVARTTTGFRLSNGSGGTWNWTASYSGDANNAPRSTACGLSPSR